MGRSGRCVIGRSLNKAILSAWGEVDLIAPASGGARSDVWIAEVNGERCAVRRSSRDSDALEWELDTIESARRTGFGAPRVVHTMTGERSSAGVVVQEFVDGVRPTTTEHWHAVRRYLVELHASFNNRLQRPGFASALDLLERDRGGDVDLTAMPEEAVARCRAAWARIESYPCSLVHGDPHPDNIVITAAGVVLLDWDESRVDVSLFDLAALPDEVSPLDHVDRQIASQAASAWEAAVSWRQEPDYARRRLREVTP